MPAEGPTVDTLPQAESQSRLGASLAALWLSLTKPVDIASLVFFRVCFGLVCFWHVWLQMPTVRLEYIDTTLHFTYYGFDWVKPLPGEWMYVIFLVMATTAIMVALGLFYRAAIVLFFLAHTYVFLIDQVGYWHHYYLISLFAFLMIFVPAHRAWSLDVAGGRVRHSDDAPRGALWMLRAQMGITYFYAGIAKLNGDWLQGKPMDSYLLASRDFPFIGQWFTEPWMIAIFSYGGILLDLLIVPLLLWRVTRIPVLVLALAFHLANTLIFNIQIFPWLALAATLLFLKPDWPRFGNEWPRLSSSTTTAPVAKRQLSAGARASLAVLSIHVLFQLLLPLRHYVVPGDVRWTSEGHFFSWRMLISHTSGNIRFFVTSSKTGNTCEVDMNRHVDRVQALMLAQRPDMIVQFAHYLRDIWKARGEDVQVHAWSYLELNGRTGRALVNPTIDLAAVDRKLGHYGFLTELESAELLTPPVHASCETGKV